MTHHVLLTDQARDEISRHADYLRQQRLSDALVDRWFTGLFDVIDSLNELPARGAVDEWATRRFGVEVRKLNYGLYTLRYRIDEARRNVYVLSFIHAARRGGPSDAA